MDTGAATTWLSGSELCAAVPSAAETHQKLNGFYEVFALDAPTDSRIDRIARLAAGYFNAPMVSVRLVERQKPQQRIERAPEAVLRPDWAFCAHTVIQDPDVPLIVSDTTRDFRFEENPLVVGPPHIRFYAGVPLVGSDGGKLGTLGIIDRVPRPVPEPRDREALKDFGRALSDLIEAIRVSGEREILAQESGHRAKNILSVTQAIIRRVGKASGMPASYTKLIEERLTALSVLHDHLAQREAGTASLDALITEMSAAMNIGTDRLVHHRTEVSLDPSQAQLFSLLLYELLTNAIKHGGLAEGAGGVEIGAVAAKPLTLRWKERANRTVTPPAHKGLGMTLIERSSGHLGVEVAMEWAPDGLACTIVLQR